MTYAQKVFNKTLSNGEAIEKLEVFENYAGFIINGKYFFSYKQADNNTLDVDSARDISTFGDEPRQVINRY